MVTLQIPLTIPEKFNYNQSNSNFLTEININTQSKIDRYSGRDMSAEINMLYDFCTEHLVFCAALCVGRALAINTHVPVHTTYLKD
jgi:hypothetical protein